MSERSYQQAQAQLESIKSLVYALETDFDRLEELRDQRDTYEAMVADEDADAKDYALSNDDLEELASLEEQAAGYDDREAVETAIQEDPLDIQVRSGWCSPGDDMEPEKFSILLATGGPAVRIGGELRGELRGVEPCRAWLEHQDWFEPWQEFHGDHATDALLTYCSRFYFG